MKLRRRWLMTLPAVMTLGYAQATNWTNLASASDLVYAIDTDSVSKDPQGYLEYLARTTWTSPSPLPGSTAPVAVSVTRFQVDCDKQQWRALETQYLSAEGAPAGTFSSKAADWARIAPGTVVETVSRRFC